MSISLKSIRFARVLYRHSLRLLPRRFYAEYAEQMELDFHDQLQDSARQGRRFLVATTVARAVGDVLLSAVRERLAVVHGELDITPRVNSALAMAFSHEYQRCGGSVDGRLLMALAAEPHGLAGVVLRELGIDAGRLRASLEESRNSAEFNAADGPKNAVASDSYLHQLTNAAACARTFGHAYIGTEHLALALLADSNGDAARMIERLGVDPISLREALAERTRKS